MSDATNENIIDAMQREIDILEAKLELVDRYINQFGIKPLDLKPIHERHVNVEGWNNGHGLIGWMLESHKDRKALLSEVIRLRGELEAPTLRKQQYRNKYLNALLEQA